MLKYCLVAVVCWAALCCSTANGLSCERARENIIKNGTYSPGDDHISCIDPCDQQGHVISNESACMNATFCHWNGSACSLKTVKVHTLDENQKLAEALSEKLGNDGRTATVPGLPFPVVPPWCVRFPTSCNIQPYDPNNIKLLDPPVNIPYCQRIPCQPMNLALEQDGIACHSVPGCYFDVELFNVRHFFGHSILPGVPACHMAVRNRKFHQLVAEYTRDGAVPWNGLFTHCLIEQNEERIFEPPAGCNKIDALEYMGVRPKLAGWEGITERECKLIGGCYTHDCFLPLPENAMQIPAGVDLYHFNDPIASTQRCQELNATFTPTHFLTAYHQCKQSGCVTLQGVDLLVMDHLLNVTMTYVPPDLRLLFWYLVQSKHVGPDNWLQKANDLMRYPESFADIYRTVDWMEFRNRLGRILRQRPGSEAGIYSELSPRDRFMLLHPEVAGTAPPGAPELPDSAFPSIPFPVDLPPAFCLYRLYEISGLLPLKGRFAGCCDRHFCYRPRHNPEELSGVAAYWAEWGAWGHCTHTCGDGVRVSTRRCVRYRERDNCHGDQSRQIHCLLEQCPQWAEWGGWGACSESCGGGGVVRRERECPAGEGCRGEASESRKCATEPCPVFGEWSEWSECEANCSASLQHRNRTCDDSNTTLACPPAAELAETRACYSYCGRPVQVSKSKCKDFPVCAVVRKYECRMKTASGHREGHCKDFKAVKRQRCYKPFRCRFCRWFNHCTEVDM